MAGKDRYIDIDLGREQCITHLGTAGQFPVYEMFRGDEEEIVSHHSKRFRVKNKFVYLVKDGFQPCWTTSFKLRYFDQSSKGWVDSGTLFEANTDTTTEKVQTLHNLFNRPNGLFTRYLRVEPIAWFNQPMLRLSVYGCDQRQVSKLGTDAQVVSYKIVTPNNSKMVINSKYNGKYRCSCCYGHVYEQRKSEQRIYLEYSMRHWWDSSDASSSVDINRPHSAADQSDTELQMALSVPAADALPPRDWLREADWPALIGPPDGAESLGSWQLLSQRGSAKGSAEGSSEGSTSGWELLSDTGD